MRYVPTLRRLPVFPPRTLGRPFLVPGRRRRFFAGLGNCSDPSIVAQITAEANAQGVPPAIALAVAQQESNCNQAAINYNPNGTTDTGMFQLNSATAPGLGVDPTSQAGNIYGGVNYLAQMFAKFGNWFDALTAYNGGPGAVTNGPGGTPSAVPATYAANVYNSAVNNYGFSDSGTVTPSSSSVPLVASSGSVYTPDDDSGSALDLGGIDAGTAIALGALALAGIWWWAR
jgi:hypothetical protein